MDNAGMVDQVVVAVTLGEPRNVVSLEQATDGVGDEDLEVVLDSAADVALFEERFDGYNLFCFGLPSGRMLVGRLAPGPKDPETKPDSQRKFFFECLIADWQAFALSGSNPWSLQSQAISDLYFMSYARYAEGKKLQAFRVDKQREIIKLGELKAEIAKNSPHTLAVLAQSVIENSQTFFVASRSPMGVVSALYGLTPLALRPLLSVAVGIIFRNRDVRVTGVFHQRKRSLDLPYSTNAKSFFNLDYCNSDGGGYFVHNPWCQCLERVLEAGGDSISLCLFSYAMERVVDEFRASVFNGSIQFSDLASLGNLLLEEFALEDGGDAFGESSDEGVSFHWDDDSGESWKNGAADPDSEIISFDQSVQSNPDGERKPKPDRHFYDELISYTKDVGAKQYEDYKNKNGASSQDAPPEDDKNRGVLDDVQRGIQEAREKGNLRSADPDKADRRSDDSGGFTLSPFALLSCKLPNRDVSLRRLDALVNGVVKSAGSVESREELGAFWAELCDVCYNREILLIRNVYIKWMTCLVNSRSSDKSVDTVKRNNGLFHVFNVISKGSGKESDE